MPLTAHRESSLTPQRRAEILLLLLTVIWGSTFVIVKSVLDENSPLWYTAFRWILSTLILGLVFLRRVRNVSRKTLVRGSILGLLLYVGFVLQTVGLETTTASKGAFLTGMLVVFTPIVHYIAQHFLHLGKKSLKVGNVFGVVCAAAGLYLMMSPAGSQFVVGDGLTLIAAFLFACYIVYLDYVSDEPEKMQLAFVRFALCALVGVVLAAGLEVPKVTLSRDFILALFYLTVFATIIAMAVQIRYQGDTTPTRAAVIFSLEPVLAGIFAYFVRGEIIGTLGVIGGAIIIVGLLLSEFSDAVPILDKSIT